MVIIGNGCSISIDGDFGKVRKALVAELRKAVGIGLICIDQILRRDEESVSAIRALRCIEKMAPVDAACTS